jgi:hypothetical protein
MQLADPKDGDFESLRVYSVEIQAALADLSNGGQSMNCWHQDCSVKSHSKLPPDLTEKWGEIMCHY